MGTYARSQANSLAKNLPFFAAPSFVTGPFQQTEVYELDTITPQAGNPAAVYPAPTTSGPFVELAGTNEGNSFTVPSGAAGKSIDAAQTLTNALGSITARSTPSTVLPYKTLGASTRGCNVSAPVEYGQMQLFGNAVLESRGFSAQSTSYPNIMGNATATFGATTGSTTLSLSAPCSCLSGNSSDIGIVFMCGTNGAYATVTSSSGVQNANVTITGTLSSTSFTYQNWYMTLPTDSNGWPTMACALLLTAFPAGGGQGQLPPGTYTGTWTDTTGNATLSGSGTGYSCVDYGRVGTLRTGTFTISSGNVNAQFFFGAALQNLVIDRNLSNVYSPPLSSPITVPQFNPACIAYHAQFTSLRLMDFLNINYRNDINWADNESLNKTVPQHPFVFGSTVGGQFVASFELAIDFINACASYPGSKVKLAHLCLPALATSAYGTSLSNLLTTYNTSQPVGAGAVQMYFEDANECWNPGFRPLDNYQTQGELECQVVGYNTGSTGSGGNNFYSQLGQISSVTQSGTTVTVNLNATVAALEAQLGLTITAGVTQFAVANLTDSTWNVVPTNGNPTNLCTVASVGTSSFTYTGPGSHTTLPASNQYAIFFNTSTNLVTDWIANGGNWNLFNLSTKWHVRKTYNYSQAWTRPQDKWLLGVQFGQVGNVAATLAQGGNNLIQLAYTYANYLGGGSTSWFQGICSAPYINAQFTAVGNGTANFTIPQAGLLAVGDTITIGGTTTTVSSVSGTNCVAATTLGSGNLNCIITANTASGAASRMSAAMQFNLSPGQVFYQQLQVNAFQAIYMGKEFYCYEGGPDLSVTAPNMQTTFQSDASAGAMVTTLMDAFYKLGGGNFNWYIGTPATFANGANGGWSICQSYSDTSSPKLVSYLGYNTTYAFATQSGSGACTLPLNTNQFNSGVTLYTSGPETGNVSFNSASVNNYIDILWACPRGNRFKFTVWATDTLTPTISLYLNPTQNGNGTLMGTTAAPANGSGHTTAAAACASIAYTVAQGGVYILRLYIPASTSATLGLLQIAVTTY